MTKEIDKLEHIEKMNEIVENYILKGIMDPSKIAKGMKMTRAEVNNYIMEWQKVAQNDYHIQARAQQALVEFDMGLDKVIQELWAIYEDGSLSQTNQIKAITEYRQTIAMRHDILQKAGLYEDVQEKEELEKAKEQIAQISELLRDIATEYPATKNAILSRLSKIFEQPTSNGVVDVSEDVEEGEIVDE